MNGLTTVTTKGQVTIPEPIRSALGILIGDKVRFERVSSRSRKIVATVIPSRVVDQTYGLIQSSVKETNYRVAKQKAGILLGQKYSSK